MAALGLRLGPPGTAASAHTPLCLIPAGSPEATDCDSHADRNACKVACRL